VRSDGCDLPGNQLSALHFAADGRVPAPDRSAEVVFTSQLLEHVPDPRAYLQEARPLLREQGLLVLSTHGRWRYHPDPNDYWWWTRDGSVELLRAGRAQAAVASVSGSRHGTAARAPALCIAAPMKSAYSQTFVTSHINGLPFASHLIYGRPLPCFDSRDRNLLGKLAFMEFLHRLWPDLLGLRAEKLFEDFHRLAVARFLRRTEARAVLAEFGFTGVAMVKPCRAAGIPLVVHFHGIDAYQDRVLAGQGRRYPELFAYASAIIAVSSDMERQLVNLGAPPEKIHKIVYGIDASLFTGADPRRSPPTFVAVGRFVEKKGPQLTLLAFAEALRLHPSARLLMIGEGPLLGPCRAMADGLGIAGRVEFLGVRSPDQVAAAMRGARAFVQHSMRAADGDTEGTPVSILEAQASGLPVVATRHAGIPEVVLDGETGFLVAERDLEAMTAAMRRLLDEPELAGRLGAAGRDRVERNFKAEASLGALAAVIERAMERGAPRRAPAAAAQGSTV
jgi:glycosyltransferase involved in cell wall biosynthesis